jgi:choline kinase
MRQAVVLAAGTGSRLRPLTDERPKCLLTIGARTLLDRLLDQLAEAGITRVVIVTGHLSSVLETHVAKRQGPPSVVCAPNPLYASTNNAVSLLSARSFLWEEGFVLCDGDVLLAQNFLRDLCEAPDPCALLVEPKATLSAEEMKAITDAEGRVQLLSKELDPALCVGESIGVQKVGGDALPLLWEQLNQMVRGGREGAYYEEAFQRLIDGGHTFRAVMIEPGGFTEIDDLADLEDARARFA